MAQTHVDSNRNADTSELSVKGCPGVRGRFARAFLTFTGREEQWGLNRFWEELVFGLERVTHTKSSIQRGISHHLGASHLSLNGVNVAVPPEGLWHYATWKPLKCSAVPTPRLPFCLHLDFIGRSLRAGTGQHQSSASRKLQDKRCKWVTLKYFFFRFCLPEAHSIVFHFNDCY